MTPFDEFMYLMISVLLGEEPVSNIPFMWIIFCFAKKQLANMNLGQWFFWIHMTT